MEKEKKAKNRFFEKFLIYTVCGLTFAVFVLVMLGFVSKLANVEKNHPVLISEDYSYVTYEGSFFYSIDDVPDDLRVIQMQWLGGARHDGESRFSQAFRDRLIYALYADESGHRYIWVRDGDYYKESYVWADWNRDYVYYDKFDSSYFYKER